MPPAGGASPPSPRHKKRKSQKPFLFRYVNKYSLLRSGLSGIQCLCKTRNLAGGLLPMDDALGGGLVQRRSRSRQQRGGGILIVRLDGGTHGLHHITDAGLDSTVTGSALQALLMTLDGRFVVSHVIPSGVLVLRMKRGMGY